MQNRKAKAYRTDLRMPLILCAVIGFVLMALLAGLAAKEAVVSTLQVLYSAGTVAELSGVISGQFTQLSAYSFLVFILLYAPCVAAMAAARRELQSRKYFLQHDYHSYYESCH